MGAQFTFKEHVEIDIKADSLLPQPVEYLRRKYCPNNEVVYFDFYQFEVVYFDFYQFYAISGLLLTCLLLLESLTCFCSVAMDFQ